MPCVSKAALHQAVTMYCRTAGLGIMEPRKAKGEPGHSPHRACGRVLGLPDKQPLKEGCGW